MAEVAAIQSPVQQIVDPKPATADAAPKDGTVSPKLSILVQREKKALELERTARQRTEAAESRFKELETREAKLKEFEEMLATNPMEALKTRGLDYKSLTDIALNDGNIPPELKVKKVEEKFDAFMKAQEEKERKAAEDEKGRAQAAEAKALEDFKGSITKFCDANPKKYELTIFDGKQDMIFEVIDEHYNRTIDPETGVGQVMQVEEAADKIEKWLRETKYAKSYELEFFKNLKPPQAKQVDTQANQFRPVQQRTLTNQLSATPSKPRTRPMTDDDRVAKAIAYARSLRS